MKKHIIVMGMFVFLAVTIAASMILYSGEIQAQTQQRAAQQRREIIVQKPSVISVTPQKVALAIGGDAVIAEVKGTNLALVGSVQVTRAGVEAQGIEETLDKSLLPTTLKVSLKASAKTQVASDYLLTFFDAGQNKLLDIANTILAIEVRAAAITPGISGAATGRPTAPGGQTTTKPGATGTPASGAPSPAGAQTTTKPGATGAPASGAKPGTGSQTSVKPTAGPQTPGGQTTVKPGATGAPMSGAPPATGSAKGGKPGAPVSPSGAPTAEGGAKPGTSVAPTGAPPVEGGEKGTKPTSTTAVASPQVRGFLKSIETARSLEEVRAGFEKAKFSQTESDGLKREIEASPVLKQKLEGLVKQEETKAQAKTAQFRREALAKVDALRSQYSTSHQVKMRTAEELLPKLPGTCPPSDKLIIEKISGEPIEPGVVFAVSGKGFGTESGSLDLMFGGHTYPAFIVEWTECYVHARLSDEITGVRPSKDTMLVLKKPDGKEIHQPTSFQPLLEYASIIDQEGITYDSELVAGLLLGGAAVDLGESKDWTKNNFQLINDWVVKDRVLQVSSNRGHAEITSASPLDVPNGSARTDVHAGREAYGYARWTLSTCVVGPKGLPYR